ncbi:MAG: pantetheine-phosphate adenylyltransferase [Rhodobacteraceae bacterium]|nr:pantetheine-phosphate adenylyltransferase [Paracoccaceae bacterium]
MKTGLYPGTFDPVTFGHIDIIRRANALVDHLVVGIAVNHDKSPLFNLEERVEMVERAAAMLAADTELVISAHPFDNLLVDCAEQTGASIIIRGLRAVSDFEYEFQMVGMNRVLNSSIETVFLMADARCQAVSSRLVKEVSRLGGDVSSFVPDFVRHALDEKHNN